MWTALSRKIARHHLPAFTEELRRIICGGKNPMRAVNKPDRLGKASEINDSRLKYWRGHPIDWAIKPESNPMEKFLNILVCPVTKTRAEYHQDKQEGVEPSGEAGVSIKDGILYAGKRVRWAKRNSKHDRVVVLIPARLD